MKIQILASGSSGNAYIIGDGETSLLLDAGIPLKAIQTGSGFRVRQLAGCFITHSHKDHSKAAKDLARLGVDIYTSAGTIEACGLSGHRIHAVKALLHDGCTDFHVGKRGGRRIYQPGGFYDVDFQ